MFTPQKNKPLLASGFDGSHKFVSHLFEQRKDGFPKLDDNDCSTTTEGMYLCGPAIRHDGHIFCFIFKYRQRFGIVAKDLLQSHWVFLLKTSFPSIVLGGCF